MLAAPPAAATFPTASARSAGNTSSQGFAQALTLAASSDPGPVPSAPQSNAKDGTQQGASVPAAHGQAAASPAVPALPRPAPATLQGTSAGDTAATIQTPIPAASALPYWIQSFSRFSSGQAKAAAQPQQAKPATREAALPTGAPVATEAASPAADQPPTGGGAPAAAYGQVSGSAPVPPAPPAAPPPPQQAGAGDSAAAIAMPLPPDSSSPVGIPPFPRVAGGQGQFPRTQPSLKETSPRQSAAPIAEGVAPPAGEFALPAGMFVAVQAASAEAKGQGETAQPGTALAAGAGSLPETSKLPAQQNPQQAPTG